MDRRALTTILLFVCAAFVVAGLWPFDFRPPNRVMLLDTERGIRLAGVGNARSREPFSLSDTVFRHRSFSFEMLVRPHREPYDDVPAVVSLCDDSGTEQLFLGQWKSTFIIRTPERPSSASTRRREIGVADALRQDRTRFIAVTTTERETSIYLDGEHARTVPRYSLLPGSGRFTGYLVIGNVFARQSFWSGDLLGLRIYDRALESHEVRAHARGWPLITLPAAARALGLIAAYDFDHLDAPRVVNRSGPLPDLVVADAFQPVHRTMLELPWARDGKVLPFAKDVVINVAGFMPFGFLFTLLLRQNGSFSAPLAAIAAVAAGALFSLAIEVTQAYLPMRNSSATDLACNVCGTIIGAVALSRSRYAPEP